MPRNLTVVVAALVVVGSALWLRHYLSPGQVVRRQLAEAVASFENEEILGVMSKISRSYTDRWGGGYESLAGHIQWVMDDYDDLDVEDAIEAVSVENGEVRVGLRFVVTGTTARGREAVLGAPLDPCRATLLWRKEQPGWRLAETEELDVPELRDELEARRVR